MLALLVAGALAQQVPTSAQRLKEAHTWKVRVVHEATLSFLIDLPEDYHKERNVKWPVLLFLHGSGESGDDLQAVRRHGPPKEIANGRKFPFIVVSPQCPDGQAGWDAMALGGLMDALERRYHIDRDREYVTGLSMGGYGVYDLIAAFPGRFAAAAPIAGIGNWIVARQMAKTPIWATHGDADPAVPFAEDQRTIDAIRRAGGDVRFDAIKGGGHDVWTDVYKGQELYDWLLSHKKS